jgi:SAM-dependent methyltransferase
MDKPENDEPIYRDGRHYDAQNKDYTADIPFYLEQCVKYGDPVLELACGTGRVTIPIAKSGFDVTGIDISSGMLNSAAVDAAQAGVKMNFIKGDIRSFQLDKKFALIIFPFNSIAHLLDLKSLIACFNCVRKHLHSDGKFIFDFFNPDINYFTRTQNVSYPVFEYPDPDSGENVIVTENNYYDRATQINHVKWHYKIREREFTHDLDMRIFYPQELDALLIHNGFRIKKFGDFNGSPFTSESPKQVYVCSIRR